MEGTNNTSLTPSFLRGAWSSTNNNETSPVNPTVDQSVAKSVRSSHSSRGNDLKNTEKMDPKLLKRVMASRNYSQKYRMKQMEYITHLETEVKALQAEVTINSPRIIYTERQNALLRLENSSIKQKLSCYNAELAFKEAQYEALKKEREMLRQNCLTNRPQALTAPRTTMTAPGTTMTMTKDGPDFQLTDMGGWNQQLLASLMEPNAFGIWNRSPMMGPNFCD